MSRGSFVRAPWAQANFCYILREKQHFNAFCDKKWGPWQRPFPKNGVPIQKDRGHWPIGPPLFLTRFFQQHMTIVLMLLTVFLFCLALNPYNVVLKLKIYKKFCACYFWYAKMGRCVLARNCSLPGNDFCDGHGQVRKVSGLR